MSSARQAGLARTAKQRSCSLACANVGVGCVVSAASPADRGVGKRGRAASKRGRARLRVRRSADSGGLGLTWLVPEQHERGVDAEGTQARPPCAVRIEHATESARRFQDVGANVLVTA
jgi:hypothetical protein